MTKPPLWFTVLAALALLWNLAGLFAVIADLQLSAAEIAALPAQQQALHAARPGWSVVASLVAVLGGTLGCVGLLLRRRWGGLGADGLARGRGAAGPGHLSDRRHGRVGRPGSLGAAGRGAGRAVGLVLLARRAAARSWLVQ